VVLSAEIAATPLAILLLLGVGLLAGLVLGRLGGRGRARLIAEALAAGEARRQAETEALLDGVKHAFGDISFDAMRKSGEDLVRHLRAILDSERRLADQESGAERAQLEARIGHVLGQIENLQGLIRELERERAERLGELGGQVRFAFERAAELAQATARLRDALVSARARGQLGERLAEDLLRRMGLVPGVHYERQVSLASGARPDISFRLEGGRSLHMDVKFPFDNWLRALDAPDEATRARHLQAFVRDGRARIGEVAARGYADPAADALPFALLLIPNEQVFAGLVEADPEVLDDALAKGVLLCSPVTLFAILVLVRESLRHERLHGAARELGVALAAFREQWGPYQEQLDQLGRGLEASLAQFHELRGRRGQALLRAAARLSRLDAAEPEARPAMLPVAPAPPER
jgi:DNA recombination protein RmuC